MTRRPLVTSVAYRHAKTAKADVTPVRQRTQFSCMSTSMMMCLQALGHDVDEDEVNKVMGARPMKGASWEQALACAQHYGVRGTLTTPSTVQQLKEWTDAGKPVMIAWNPEGREWSHASVVFDVDDDLNVHVADPNIPDPDETVRVIPKSEFYSKWYEKWPNYLVRRPALMLDREITPEGKQVMASQKKASSQRVAEGYDRQRDRQSERGTYRRRSPRKPRPPSAPNPSMKTVKEKKDVIDSGGLEVTLVGKQRADGFIHVAINYPVTLYGANPVQEAIRKWSLSDRSWVAQGTALASRRYWLVDSPGQHGGWSEVRSLNDAMRETEKALHKVRVASRMASRRGPPNHMGSAAMLKRQGFTPVDVMFGETLPHRRAVIKPGEGLLDRSGNLKLFVGINGDGTPILARDERELKVLSKQLIQDRLHVTTASTKRVAARHTRLASGERLDRSLRQKINKAMERKGLEGNGRFRKPEEGYSRAVEVMQDHGIELDEVVSSHLFSPRPSGTVKADIAYSNEQDPFSPVSITNSILYLQYTELREGMYEVVAYLS